MTIFFYILIRHWKAFEYFDRCIESVLNQTYKNYKILFVDDASGYDEYRKRYIKEKLKGHIVVFNKYKKFSVRNGYEMIYEYCINGSAVVVNLDGDDWFIDNNVLSFLNKYYVAHPEIQLTYGNCVLWNGKNYSKPAGQINKYWNHSYPKKIVDSRNYRKHPFLPLHLRTWKVSLYKRIGKYELLRPNGEWLRFAEDQAFFYPMLEMVNANVGVIEKSLYVYNVATKQSDYKINLTELLKDELIIRRKYNDEQ